jgi:hypothetical protein
MRMARSSKTKQTKAAKIILIKRKLFREVGSAERYED